MDQNLDLFIRSQGEHVGLLLSPVFREWLCGGGIFSDSYEKWHDDVRKPIFQSICN